MLKAISQLPIRIKILSSSIITLLLICTFIFIYYPYYEKKEINRSMQKKTQNMVEMVALGVGVGMGTSNFELITEAINWTKQDSDLDLIMAIDENREVFASYNPSKIEHSIQYLLANNDIVEQNGKAFHIAKAPIKYQNTFYGTIIMVSSLEEYYKLINDKSFITLIVSLSILAFGIILSFIFSKTITKPLSKLQKAANKIAEGNYDINIKVVSDDEIGVLGRNFNVMAGKINLLVSQLEGEIKVSKKTQDALIESEGLLRSFMERVPIGIYRTTPDGRFLYANPSLVKFLGYNSFEELQKINLEEQGFENLQKRKLFKEKIETFGDITQHEDIYVRNDGSKIVINEYAICVRDDDDNVKYYEGIVEEVTERKKAEESLRQSQQLLKELNDSKDRFFSIIAHDLKNPLGSFTMSTQMMSNNWEIFNEDEKIQLINQMYLNSKNLLQLLENLLTWASSQSQSLEFKRTNFDLFIPVGVCVELLNATAVNKGIELRSEVRENTNVNADYNMITTVIRNLISNAIKFTNKSGYIIISSDKATEDENYMVVSIKDNGVGMDKEDVGKLFRIDSRQSSPGTSDEKGTGLGLLICKDFVEKNKGKIWVESEKGKGSTFSFTVLKHE